MNKIYRSYFIFFLALTFAGTVLAFAAVELVDPKGENDFSIGLDKNYFSSVLNARRQLQILSTRPSIVVFGTSRSSYLSPQILGGDVLNMHVIYANPHAVLDFLGRLDDRQISNITGIYYLLDYFAFNGTELYDPVDYQNAWQRVAYKIKGFGGSTIRMSWDKIVNNLTRPNMSYATADGYPVILDERTYDGKVGGEARIQDFREDTVALLARVDGFAKRRGIEVTYFMAPFPEATLRRLDMDKHAQFSRAALKYIDGFYDWTYVDSISPNNDMFSDAVHAKFAPLKRLFTELKTPEYYVDDRTIDYHLNSLKPYLSKIDLK
ncbi:MAG: hypothetical protein ACTSV1_02160 [Alphaproteobacteria bacterium]